MRARVLEICAETLQGCSAAKKGGADRIELCSALSLGGITPSSGLVQQAIAISNLPIYVLLRPRTGNFVYSAGEFHAMCADLEQAAGQGASGFVSGMLHHDGSVDIDRMSALVRLAGAREVSFHRAFDHTSDPSQALEQVIDSGCRRLLTSGGAPTAMQGLSALVCLNKQAAGRIRVAVGGGVTLATASCILEQGDFDLHASLRTATTSTIRYGGDPLWDDAAHPSEVLVEDVRRLAALAHGTNSLMKPMAQRR